MMVGGRSHSPSYIWCALAISRPAAAKIDEKERSLHSGYVSYIAGATKMREDHFFCYLELRHFFCTSFDHSPLHCLYYGSHVSVRGSIHNHGHLYIELHLNIQYLSAFRTIVRRMFSC